MAPDARPTVVVFSRESVGDMRVKFPSWLLRSITSHRSVDLAGPGFDAAVEIDGVVKAGAAQKVDHPLTAGAMMTNNHQGLMRRKIVDARGDVGHRNMQGAF